MGILKGFDWKGVIRNVAPALATTFGTPLAGTAASFLCEKLLGEKPGEGDTAKSIEKKISAYIENNNNPDTLIKLKELDSKFKLDMEKLGIDVYKIDAEDRSSARERQVAMRDWTPNILAFVILTIFGIVLYKVLGGGLTIEAGVRDIAFIMIGALIANTNQVISYFFGSSKGSKDKTAALAHVIKKVT